MQRTVPWVQLLEHHLVGFQASLLSCHSKPSHFIPLHFKGWQNLKIKPTKKLPCFKKIEEKKCCQNESFWIGRNSKSIFYSSSRSAKKSGRQSSTFASTCKYPDITLKWQEYTWPLSAFLRNNITFFIIWPSFKSSLLIDVVAKLLLISYAFQEVLTESNNCAFIINYLVEHACNALTWTLDTYMHDK